ncbi:MAG TPA: molybdopterin-synthase adenylyltransferase MoeB [Actinomycetota bacterium]|nr:molybdopterin-synthase adenylyltransferase MoeB [Actinomycetota bacterium]
MSEFTEDQIHRYARHIILPEVGGEGQRKLLDGRVLVVGTGGLGSPVALYLAAAGVGTIGLVDFDDVDITNLQRQVLHGTADVGRPKTTSGAETIGAINPDVNVVEINQKLDSTNAFEAIEGFDLVIDGSDNFPTRYLLNDACYLTVKPLVSGAIFQFEGQITVFDQRRDDSPCYRCLFPLPPPPGSVPNCAQAGVFGVLAGTVGTIQATEAIKLLAGIGEPLIGYLLLYDALETRFTRVRVRRDDSCPLCGSSPEIKELVDYEEFCGVTTS